ncbi:alpha/beta-hydrolase, partial [Martensiomyces pterosporus]
TNGFTCGEACSSARVKNTVLNTTWHNPNPVSDGYIAVNTKDREIYVVWTGTRRIRSAVVDAVFVFQDFPSEIPGSAVHAGFLQSTNSAYPYILKNIRAAADDFPEFNIVFLGHSLGGGNAVLSALEYARDNEDSKDRIRVWTFGEPRVGNRAFAEYYTQMLGNQTYRITYQADVVPHVPPWQILGYQHHPLEIHVINRQGDFYVCQNTVREDLDGAYRWPTIDTGVADHLDYFGMPDITHFDRLIEW